MADLTMGTADRSPLKARLRHGREDYLLGGHPVWQVLRAVFQMRNRPYVLGGAALLLGYLQAMFSGRPRPVSDALVRFHRAEQSARLRAMFLGALGGGLAGAGQAGKAEPRAGA